MFRTNRKGNGSGKARSHTFKSDSSETYVVLIYTTAPTGGFGDVVACAQLKEKRKHAKHHKHAKSHSKTHGKGGTHGKGRA